MNMQATDSEPKRLYKSTMKFCNVTMPNGHVLHFKGGMFVTDNPDYIEYLDTQIKQNAFGQAIFIDPKARTLSAEEENPMLALKRKFYEEFQAEQLANLNPSNDMGASVQDKLRPASTSDIAAVVAGGDATARLVNLATPK